MRITSVLIIFIAAACLALILETQAEEYSYDFSLKDTFNHACLLYSKSQFTDAIKELEEIIAHGYESPNIYYNLGNAYFKTASLGKAILNYERAKKLSPHDSDLRSNLEYALSLTEKPPMDRTRIWLMQRINNFLDSFSIDALTVFSCIIYIGAISFLITAIFLKYLKRFMRAVVAVASLIFLISLTLLVINIYRSEYIQKGIVLSKEVEVRFEPREDAIVHYRLYEGSVVYEIKTKEGWGQIKREDGKVGWLPESSYEIIGDRSYYSRT